MTVVERTIRCGAASGRGHGARAAAGGVRDGAGEPRLADVGRQASALAMLLSARSTSWRDVPMFIRMRPSLPRP